MTADQKTLQAHLKRLLPLHAVSGAEDAVRQHIADIAQEVADQVTVDAMGNLFAWRRGGGKGCIALCTHMDEPGLVVTHIDANGYLFVQPVGSLDAAQVTGRVVRFSSGVEGVVVRPDGKNEPPEDFRTIAIDIGADTRETATRVVGVGARGALLGRLVQRDSRILGKGVADRIGSAVLLSLLSVKPTRDTCYVFSAQEKLGGRGLKAWARGFDGEAVLAVGPVSTKPNQEAVTIGQGPVLVVQNASYVAHKELAKRVEQMAQEIGQPLQWSVDKDGDKGLGFVQRSGSGVPAALIGIPARHLKSQTPAVDLTDAAGAQNLLKAAVTAPTLV